MKKLQPTVARQIAKAASTLQLRRTDHGSNVATVVVSGVALHEASVATVALMGCKKSEENGRAGSDTLRLGKCGTRRCGYESHHGVIFQEAVSVAATAAAVGVQL